MSESIPMPVPGPRPCCLILFLAGVPSAQVMETSDAVTALIEDSADDSWFHVTEIYRGTSRPARYRVGLVAGMIDLG